MVEGFDGEDRVGPPVPPCTRRSLPWKRGAGRTPSLGKPEACRTFYTPEACTTLIHPASERLLKDVGALDAVTFAELNGGVLSGAVWEMEEDGDLAGIGGDSFADVGEVAFGAYLRLLKKISEAAPASKGAEGSGISVVVPTIIPPPLIDVASAVS